jgi:hypothetical protein
MTEPGASIAERMIAALRTGTWLDLIPEARGGVLDEDEMRGWGDGHDVDSGLLRDLLLRRGLEDADPDPRGLRLRGARIRGRLDLDLVDTTVALELVDCLLDHGVTAEQAHIPVLRLRRCRFGHSNQIAFVGDYLRVDGGLDLDGAVFTMDSEAGAVRLIGARIGGSLSLRGAIVRNSSGPALQADRLQTGGSVFLGEGLTAEGAGNDGAVRLLGARIGDQLSLSGATLRNSTGPALDAYHLRTGGTAYFDEGFTAEGAVQLLGARIGGNLILSNSDGMRSRSGSSQRWEIDGLTYQGVPRLTRTGNRDACLELLRAHTPRYAAQPYQQLAAAYRAEGHDSDVRRILMAQRRDQITRGGLSRQDRRWAQTTGLLLGYGYQPWRALLYLAGVLVISVGLTLWLGGQGGLARSTAAPTGATTAASTPTATPAATTPGASAVMPTPCTLVQTVGRGLDLGAPFLPAAPAVVGSCQPTASMAGEVLTVARWALQLIAWALAALFIAGFTGIVRKT